MKKIFYFSLFFLSIGFSLQAMDDVRIVPYDYEKHHQAAEYIFLNAFSDASSAHPAIVDPNSAPLSRVIIAEKDSAPIGFAVYNHETLSTTLAFSDMYRGTQKPRNVANVKICRLPYIAVHPAHTGNGCGQKLMDHIEEQARQNNDDVIALSSIHDTNAFYENKCAFIETTPGTTLHFMAKPLNENMSGLLGSVIEMRRLRQGSGISPSRLLV